MKNKPLRIRSISQLHEMSGFEKPRHPLITVIDVSQWEIGPEWLQIKIVSELYSIALKDGSCGLEYGRNTYDFEEGVLSFTAPKQVLTLTKAQKAGDIQGWMLFFHPDLIRNMPLGQRIEKYGFFGYDVHEALHLSEQEQQSLTECIHLIRAEIQERIDNHSQSVICSTLELLLNYSARYYERQFNTRQAQNKDVVSQFERALKNYYQSDKFATEGIPSIQYLAEQVHLSPNYLSDLLKKETGYSAKDQINSFLVEKAKTLLLSDSDSISGIAYQLGFNYPHYFSRFFKSKTGFTPQAYRKAQA